MAFTPPSNGTDSYDRAEEGRSRMRFLIPKLLTETALFR